MNALCRTFIQAGGAVSSYCHCLSDVHLYCGSSLMLRTLCSLKFLSGSFVSGN